MGEATSVSDLTTLANTEFNIGGQLFRFANKHQIIGLFRQGFVPSGNESDFRNPDFLLEHGRMLGIEPGRGIVAEPDKIKPDIVKQMNETYGVGNWQYVELISMDGKEWAMPMIKPRQPR